MRMLLRQIWNKIFTQLAFVSVLLLIAVLVVILVPMFYKGAKAVVFRGTVEFRKMQLALYDRGNASDIKAESERAEKIRAEAYQILDQFKRGIDTSHLRNRARTAYREFGRQLRYQNVNGAEYASRRSLARQIRDKLKDAFENTDKNQVELCLEFVLQFSEYEQFKDSAALDFFRMANEYKQVIEKIDLTKRSKYEKSLAEVQDCISHLFGPRPAEPLPALTMDQYGATRWDTAEIYLDKLLWAEEWVQQEVGKPLKKIRYRRAEQFAGTELEPLFGFVEENISKALRPKLTFYWQYFLDDSTPGHFFGGVGPEILGTLLLTLLAIVFAVPLGIISAAYLIECASHNTAVKIIRMCVNTLAGVPSIVFGLFGLAFFVLYLLPLFDLPPKPCILTASLTLAILILPVIIRASEEAIRAVPQTYKEASLALGASRFKTFITVIFPAALPGILTGIILSLGRAAGETAPILFTGVVALGPKPKSLLDATRALSYGSYDIAVVDRLAMMVPHKQFGMLMTLILLVLCLNITAIVIRSRVSKKLQGN